MAATPSTAAPTFRPNEDHLGHIEVAGCESRGAILQTDVVLLGFGPDVETTSEGSQFYDNYTVTTEKNPAAAVLHPPARLTRS